MFTVSQSFKDKLMLLAIGSLVSVVVFFFGIWSDQFLSRADYDKDRITNAAIVARVDSGLENINGTLIEVKQELKDLRKEIKDK